MATINVRDANNNIVAIEKPLVPGRTPAATARPVVLSDEDAEFLNGIEGALASILAALSGTPSLSTATIANGQSLSPAVDLATTRVVRIQMPAVWTAANLTFQTSSDGVTYADLYDATGSEYTIVAGQGQSIVIPRDDFIGTRYLKVRSGPASAAVAQGGSRAITLVLV